MTVESEKGIRNTTDEYLHTITPQDRDNHCHDDTSMENSDFSHWWFLSTAFPLIAGTLGPVASAFSICSMVEPWRQQSAPGEKIQNALFVDDPSWLLIVEAIQLLVGLVSNLFLLLYMAKRLRFNLALPVTIIGWYASCICRITLTVIVARPLKDAGSPEGSIVWSQSFYYGMWAAILYFVDASLLVTTFWGACTSRYSKMLLLTSSQRTLMLQSIMLLLYLLLGAYVFSNIESWQYLDAVYWAVVTLFTVGFGDYYPDTELGRGLLIPFALAGIISLGLVINSVRNLIFEEGSRCVTVRIGNKKREKTVNKILLNSANHTLEPIQDDIRRSSAGLDTSKTEFDRRKAEFNLMRRIQAEASTRRRWVAMGISTFSWLVLWLLGALVFQKAEHTYQGWSYFDALYFCFEAWTTIGYGDLSPVSNAGRSFYVFWSLLALPTMTVLISNASNTVVRVIRDITVLVGNITILPNDRPFLRNVKGLVHKITFGKLFSDLASEPSRSTACGNGARKQSIENLQQSSNEYCRRFASTSVPRVPILPLTGPLHANFPSLSTPDLSKRAQELTTAVDFQLLLTSEIRTVTGHLQEPQPHHYTFDEWVWYLKLLGEDEHSSKTHCRVETGHSRSQSSEDGYNGSAKWSWIGDQSPLLSCQLESEWILTRLIEKMRESLLLSKRVQVEDYRDLSYQRGQEKL